MQLLSLRRRGPASDCGGLSSTAEAGPALSMIGREGFEQPNEDEELDNVDEAERPTFIFSVDAFARKAWLQKWKISAGHLQRADSVDQCKALPDCTGIVGHLKDIVDPDAEFSKMVFGTSIFDLLLKATSVQTSSTSNHFPLSLVSGLHISKLILSMIEAWDRLKETDHGLSREEVCDIEEAINLISSTYPARLRNGSKFDAPKSLRGLAPKDAFDLVLLAQSMASGSREANVIPKTAAQTLKGFVEILDKLPREQRNVNGLLETFKRLTGNYGIDKTNVQYLKAILDASKGHEADKELEKMRIEQTNLNLSKFALIQTQAVRLATEALRESQKKCIAYKSQVESDLTDAANEMLDNRVTILDYTGSNAKHDESLPAPAGVPLSAGCASTPMTSLSGGWVEKAAPFMRAVLQGRPPDVIYIDLVDDRFGNGPEHARCTIPCRDRGESETIEYFVREVLEQAGTANPQKATVLLRVQMSEQCSGLQMSSGINLLGAFASKKVRENDIPVVPSDSKSEGPCSAPTSSSPWSDDEADNPDGLDSAPEEGEQVPLGKRVVYRRRPYWNIGSVELSLKEQYEAACLERETKHKRKSRASVASRRSSISSSRTVKLPALVQETIFVIERTVKRPGPEGSKRPLESCTRQAFRERYYRDDEQKSVIVAEKVDPLSKEPPISRSRP
ncbi:hypothetical protein FOZ60_013285 [Perkinsus olseni]|uniref:Uncharacterized protein n=1 Tax=Perkinsus olseni TaxID=32597 RepID=A0A7J6N9V1_PEROL|nr:hypothetical protein FOZ60_013285 [Perkinsus olseni]